MSDKGQVDTIKDIHWLMDILQNIDVGLVVLDRNYEVQLWNAFMEGHSGQPATGQREKPVLVVPGSGRNLV